MENPDEIVDLPAPFAAIPPQQVPFYDRCERLTPESDFGAWINYAMKAKSFHASEVIEALTWFDMPSDEEAAYDAPFPSRTYVAGARVFPSLVNELPGVNQEAWAGLTSFEKPFLTLWASNDPGQLGSCETQQRFVDSVPGAKGLPHDRLAEASHLATLEVEAGMSNDPYIEHAFLRNTVFTFDAGEEIYELTSPASVVYVMQSMSQIVDPALTMSDLPTLDSRLVLPSGWTYQARTLDAELVLEAAGEAIVVQDDLSNTYQRK